MSGAREEDGFPAPVYKETVLAPLFEGVKRHHWRHQMRINRASAIMLAARAAVPSGGGGDPAGARRHRGRHRRRGARLHG